MSRSTSHPLFITALFALMVTACASAPTPTERGAVEVEREPGETLEAAQARKAQYEKAKAVFDERCKTAGVKIYKTVEDVEGVFLVDSKLGDSRPSYEHQKDPNWVDTGLPWEPGERGYILSFLFWEHPQERVGKGAIPIDAKNRGGLSRQPSNWPGYRYADVKKADGSIERHTLGDGKTIQTVTYKQLLNASPTRYAISRTNHIDPADRALWVAGTTVTITDTQTNEVLATSTWYSFDPGQGGTKGYRSPWLEAQTCPELRGSPTSSPTRFFVDQVLKPEAH